MTTLAVAGRVAAPVSILERPPNKVALQITGRPYVSHSQLSLMRSCPKKFQLQYIEKAPNDFIPVSLLYGGAIHAGIESYYRAHLEGMTLSAGDMLAAYHSAWRQTLADAGGDLPIRFGAKEDEKSVHALAQRAIAAFLESPLATPKGDVVGVEEKLTVELHPELPDLLAKVDLVTNAGATLFITDFKTSRSRWSPAKAIESSDQLVLYASATAELARSADLPVKLAFAVLTKTKTPQVQILPVPADAGRISAITASAVTTWKAIIAGNFYPNPSPMNCSTCPFKSRCPAFAGT